MTMKLKISARSWCYQKKKKKKRLDLILQAKGGPIN